LPFPSVFLGGKKGQEEREQEMEETGDDTVETCGSTRVEFRESGYFRQIIENC
jgi:hypothetical protein